MARTDKGIIPLKPSLISSHLIAYYHTDATDWNQTKPVRDSALGWAVWPSGRLQTQVVSQRSASMSVASTRRSTFRPETWVSSKSTTRQSPLPRTSIFLHIPEHQAAATTRRQALFPLCGNEVGLGLVPRNCRRITSLLQVGPAPRRFVRTWIVKQLFQVFFGSVSKVKRNRDQHVVQTLRGRKVSTKSLNGELNWPSEEKNWLSKDYTKLRQTWRSNIGKREILTLLFMRSIRSSNPNDYNYNKRINGLIRIKTTK